MAEQAAILPALILLPMLGAALPPLFRRYAGLDPAITAGAVAGCTLLAVLSQRASAFGGELRLAVYPWMPEIGLEVAFRLDGYAYLFALLITMIGALVILYARYYLSAADATGRFYAWLLLFMAAMLGVVLSENLLQLLVFWELTSLVSFLLIGYWGHRGDAREGARLALLVTGGGGLALLAGILLLGDIAGSFRLTDVLAARHQIRLHPLYPPMLALIALGVFTKSAQFPFHFWLPHAMAAPTPVSAYLHSATMVKAGVFLLGRLFPVLSGTDEWFYLVGGAGIVTLLLGAYHALFQHDMKGLLAYSTISHLGLITFLFGLGSSSSAIAAVFHIMNHAVFKCSLFMATGIIDHETGTRDMRRINGMFKYMPYTAVLAIVAAAAMAGVPLLNGFLSKEMFFTQTVHEAWLGYVDWSLPALALLAGIGSVAYSMRFVHDVFFNGEPVDLPRSPHEPPLLMRVPVAVLVLLCVAVGVAPEQIGGPLLRIASAAVLQRTPPEFDLAIWHGFNLPFAMSLAAMAGGAVVYANRHRIFALHSWVAPDISGKNTAEALVLRALALAEWAQARFENGSLQRYVLLLVAATVVVGVVALAGWPLGGGLPGTPANAFHAVVFAVMAVAGLGTAALHRNRLVAVLMLGAVGLMVAIAFAMLSAPDLAMTQLLVEIATVIVLLLALGVLPARGPVERRPARHRRDVGLAVLAGAGAAAVTWAMTTLPLDTISGFFVSESVPGGGGHNVVNVILVDFRGFDTLGEVTVLAIAAVGVVAMLHGLRMRPPAAGAGELYPVPHPVVLLVVSRALLPMAAVTSLYLLLRGHNAPGGGFIAALVLASALVLQYLASGVAWARARRLRGFVPILAAGILVAVATGLGSWIVGHPFLTSTHAHLHLPLVGEVEVASALLFDVGVYLAVIGSVMVFLVRPGALVQKGGPDRREGDG